MKKKGKVKSVLFIAYGLVFCIGGIFSQKAEADTGFSFQPRASVGWINYTLEIKASDSLAGIDWNLSDSMVVGNIGATFFLSKLYFDLSYEHTTKGQTNLSAGRFYEAADNPYIPMDADITIVGDSEFYHWNYTITLGYQLLDNFSLFAGYKKNETSFDVDTQAVDHLIDDGSLTGTPGFPIFFSYIGDFDVDYDAKGPFLGGTYGFIVGDKGVLNLNLAVAFLEGGLNQSGDVIDPRTGIPDDIFDMNSSGNTIGVSYGIGWRSTLTDRLGYFLSFKGYNYDFEADDNDQSDFKETTYQFSLGLSYNF